MGMSLNDIIEDIRKSTGATDEELGARLKLAIEKGSSLETIANLEAKTAECLEKTTELLNKWSAEKEREAEAAKFEAEEAEIVARFKAIGDNVAEKQAYLNEVAGKIGATNAQLLDPSVDGMQKMLWAPISKNSPKYEETMAARKAADLVAIYCAFFGGLESNNLPGKEGQMKLNKGILESGIAVLKKANYPGIEYVEKGTANAYDSLTAGEGYEWVPQQILSRNLYQDIWLQATVASSFIRMNMPGPTVAVPIRTGRATAYGWSQSTAVADFFSTSKVQSSSLVTDLVTFTAKKVGVLQFISDELVQDAIIPMLERLYEEIVFAMSYGLEDAVINGSTATNDLDNASTDTNRLWANTADAGDGIRLNTGSIDMRYQWDGIRKSCLTSAKQSSSSFSRSELLDIRRLMKKYGTNQDDLVLAVSPELYIRLLAFNEVTPMYSYGANATILTGELGKIDGVRILVSPKVYSNLNASGVFDNVTKTKTLGILYNRKAYQFGDRMDMRVETDRQIISQQRAVVASARLDFRKMFKNTEPTEAILYNVAS